MNITYLKYLQILESFASEHIEVRRFASDFYEQLQNFTTKGKSFPVLYVVPQPSVFSADQFADLNLFTVDVYCFDIIAKDRSNINTILGTTSLILNDLHKWLKDGDIPGVEVITSSQVTPMNNSQLDYLAGWKITITSEVETYSVCQIPFENSPVISVDNCDVTYSQFLTCETVTGCTSIQQYIENQLTGATSVTGFTYSPSNNTFTIGLSDNTTFDATIDEVEDLTVNGSLSATTYYGDGSNLTGINSTEVTGFTFNPSTYELNLDQDNNNNFTVDLSILSSDVTITGGTYNPSNGTATFTNNTGGTFNVTGFLTGFTDIYTTGVTYNNTTKTLSVTRNDGVTLTTSGWTDTNYMPSGGTTGQILAKIDNTNYNTEWIDNYTSTVKHLVKAGEALTKGQAVYISTADGTNMIAMKASNTSEPTSSQTMGIVAQDLAHNATGFVITEGLLEGTGGEPLNTSTATAGDPIWLGVNGGLIFGIANKPVAPAHTVYLGTVTRSQNVNGEIFIRVSNGWELDELHNVLISGVTNNQVLTYNSSNQLWENKQQNIILLDSHIGGSNTDNETFSRLRDVLIPANTLSNGDIIDVEFVVFQNFTSVAKTARLHLTQSLATPLGTANDIATTPQNLTSTVQHSLYRTLMYWDGSLQLLQLDTATAVTDPVTNVTASTELLWPFDPTVNNWLSISAGSTANNTYTKTLTRSIMRLTKKQ